MSSKTRKIGFYNIIFFKLFNKDKPEKRFFDKEKFIELIKFIDEKSIDQRLMNIKTQSKAIVLQDIIFDKNDEVKDIQLVFKVCKYNHKPPYMSSKDGTERESDKEIYEGEKELVHVHIKVFNKEACITLEERMQVLGIKKVIDYLNYQFKEYLKQNNEKLNQKLIYGIVTSDSFEDNLKSFQVISSADVFTDKKYIGSEGMNLTEETDGSMRDQIVLSMKSNPKESLGKRLLNNLYKNMIAQDAKINRIRVYGRNNENVNILMDSNILRKIDTIDTKIDDDGLVNTDDILEKLRNIANEVFEE